MMQRRSTADDASLVEFLLEREEKVRQDAKEEKVEQEAKIDKLRQEMEAKAAVEKAELRREMEVMRAALQPVEAISERRLAALQARVGTIISDRHPSEEASKNSNSLPGSR
jgi:hypothetical protein